MTNRVWIYEATVVRHVDGDTTVMDIDQGMNQWARNQYIRYAGINAPELSTQEGKDALYYLESLIDPGSFLWLATIEYHEFEKYGRVLAAVYLDAPDTIPWKNAALKDLMNGSINQAMIDMGHAVWYDPSNL